MTTKRLVRNIFFIAAGFVLLLIILAEIFKNDMVKLAIKKSAHTFDVPLTVGEVDFSLLYRFPLATIEFNDVVVFGDQTNDSLHAPVDTIAGISKLYASVDILHLLKGNILVRKIEIEDVKATYMVDSLGRSNFDFLMEGMPADTTATVEDTTKVQGVYTLDQLQLTNIRLKYDDRFLNAAAQVHIPIVKMNGKVEPSGFKAATSGAVVVQSLRYDSYNLESLNNSTVNFDITALNDQLDVSNFSLQAGTAVLNLTGSVNKKDSALVDIQFSGRDIDIAENLSILPAHLLSGLKVNKASGKIDVDGSAKGFITKNVLPQVNVDIHLVDGAVQYDTYPEVRNMVLNASFFSGYSASIESSVIHIKKFQAQTNQSNIALSARIQNPKQASYDVSASVSTNLNELQPFVELSSLKQMSGKLSASLTTAGVLPDSIGEDFVDYLLSTSKFNLSMDKINLVMDSVPAIQGLGGKLAFHPGHIKISDLKVDVPGYNMTLANGYMSAAYQGKVSDYERLLLQIDSLLLATPYSYVSASGHVKGLSNVNYALNTAVNINLLELKQWLPSTMANSMSGSVAADFSSAGMFAMDSVEQQSLPLLFENSELSIVLNDVFTDMSDSLMNVKMLSGHIKYKNDSVCINKLGGSYLGLDFAADSTTISNVYTAAVQNNPKEMLIKGNFEMGDMDYAWLDGFMVDTVPNETVVDDAEIVPEAPLFTYKVKGKAKVKSFKYGDVLIENLNTQFLAKISEGYYVADQLTCNAFGGDVGASVIYEMFPNFRGVMHFKSNMQNVDMSRMLKELETYIDQEDFTDKNVLGKLSAQMDGKIILKDYEPVYDSMLLKGNLMLQDGALINVKPVMDIEDIAFIGLKNMDKLYFSTLESQLFLFKNKMYFPRTEIRSSSFDGMFFGMYSFGEDYAYHVKMYMNHVLSGKSKASLKKQAQDNGFDEEDDKDGRNPIYVVSKSENGKSKAWLDNRKDRLRMDAKVNLQEQMVSFRFNPQLVIYSTEE